MTHHFFCRNKELSSQDAARKLQRQLRDLREDYATSQQKETEVNAKKNELEKQLELAEAETVLAKNDLKLAMKRIEDLQTAINVELDSESDSLNRYKNYPNYGCLTTSNLQNLGVSVLWILNGDLSDRLISSLVFRWVRNTGHTKNQSKNAL